MDNVKPLLIENHFSSREGGRIHLLVLHTTEGEGTLEGLHSLFESEEASSHYGSNANGNIAQFVLDRWKAWTECNYNPVSLSLEQIGYAAFTKDHWFNRHDQLEAAAKFLTYGHVHYGVPLRQGEVNGGGIVRDGVVQHKDLGLIGCGHTDCGDGYPQDYVMLLARYYIAHKLHHNSVHVHTLKKQINGIRKHYHVPLIP